MLVIALAAAGILSTMLSTAGCRRGAQEEPASPICAVPSKDEFSVMTYNLYAYGLEDRDGDGQADDPKPRLERDAVLDLIARANPDVLAVEEIGGPAIFEQFRYALKERGLDYSQVEYLQRGQSQKNIAVLSRLTVAARDSHDDMVYSIGEARVPVARGFIDLVIEPCHGYRFRLLVAHLKSKVYHQLGQTEMRRNEARLLGKLVRHYLRDHTELNLLVVGDMNDDPRSAALREIIGKRRRYLIDLRPTDVFGDVWTHFSKGYDHYERIDYMLVSRGMYAEVVAGKTCVVRDRLTYVGSDHRPVLAVFKNHDCRPPAEDGAAAK